MHSRETHATAGVPDSMLNMNQYSPGTGDKPSLVFLCNFDFISLVLFISKARNKKMIALTKIEERTNKLMDCALPLVLWLPQGSLPLQGGKWLRVLVQQMLERCPGLQSFSLSHFSLWIFFLPFLLAILAFPILPPCC